MTCRHCGKPIAPSDNFCRYCGKSPSTAVLFRYTHAGIILLTILLGPVALPFIIKSPVISRNVRIAYIAVNAAFSLFMIVSIFGIYQHTAEQVQETLKILDQTGTGTLK